MASFKIRLFEKKDADVVVKLARDYAAFDRAMPKDWLLSTYKKHPNSIRVAEAGGKIVGFAIGYQTKTPMGTMWGNIELMAVHPNHRRIGIGTKLVETLLEEFEKADVKQAYLFCPATAKDAKELYEKLGFEVNAYHMRRKM